MIEKIPVRQEGLVATLFKKKGAKSSIIVLGGSSGGLQEEHAKTLAEHGFTSLALAYFGAENLPKKLQSIPLEYFQKAIDFLKGQGMEKIALWGGSRGAELSLLLGTLFPDELSAIAAHVPSSMVFDSLDEDRLVAWTLDGKPVIKSASIDFDIQTDGTDEEKAIKATPSFLSFLQKAPPEESVIPVEKIRCPLLLISAEDDQMWPSSIFAKQIEERLKEFNSSIECLHYSYEKVGHSPAKGEVGLHPVMKRWFAFGGEPQANKKAAQDWIEQTISFFKERL